MNELRDENVGRDLRDRDVATENVAADRGYKTSFRLRNPL